MKILVDPHVEKWLNKLPAQDLAQIKKYHQLFTNYGFNLGQPYLKKISFNLWELRPGSIRLFIIKVKLNCVVIHAMYKKSQRMTKETLKILKSRITEYQ